MQFPCAQASGGEGRVIELVPPWARTFVHPTTLR